MNRFEIIPYVGALPLRFGMTQAEVRSVIQSAPGAGSRADRDQFPAVGVNYDEHGLAAEFCFLPRFCVVRFMDQELIGPEALRNPVDILLEHDPNPVETLGFLIFPKVGVNLTGYHDDLPGERALNVFRRGFWDEFLPKAKPYGGRTETSR